MTDIRRKRFAIDKWLEQMEAEHKRKIIELQNECNHDLHYISDPAGGYGGQYHCSECGLWKS